MIFSGDLADKVVDGSKTQTRRPAKMVGAYKFEPCQYVVGRDYAIQRKRGGHGLGPRIRILSVTLVPTYYIWEDDAVAEGFTSPDEFYERWESFYGTRYPACWRIEFELADVRAEKPRADAPPSSASLSPPAYSRLLGRRSSRRGRSSRW